MDNRCDDHQHMSRPPVVTSGGTVHLRCDMERVIRLLRLARLRRDLLAIATLETRLRNMPRARLVGPAPDAVSMTYAQGVTVTKYGITESELRALWGDR